MKKEVTSIQISKQFKGWLESKGKKGESFEDIIKKLVKSKNAK